MSIPSVDVFGTEVSVCSTEEVARMILRSGRGKAVAISNVHSVMSARRDADLSEALATADIVTPDGVPVVWAMKASGTKSAQRVTGIDVMRAALRMSSGTDVGHFFYGGTPDVLEALVTRVEQDFPGAVVSGSLSPPFKRLTLPELAEHARQIRDSGATVVWVGLGMPKQELWMHDVAPALPGVSLVGVGAAFDWFADNKRRAPQWMQRAGLEWAYRLAQEPGRLWRRYILNNPLFMVHLTMSWLRNRGARRVSARGPSPT